MLYKALLCGVIFIKNHLKIKMLKKLYKFGRGGLRCAYKNL